MPKSISTDSIRTEVTENPFPPTEQALSEPNGLLARGGNLLPDTLLLAYAQGIFPWFESGEEILWWSPEPRMVLRPADVHISRSLRKTLRNSNWQLRYDTDFNGVIKSCAETRHYQGPEGGTWISREMQQAYEALHHLGAAHSIEVFSGNTLVGGLYGILIDHAFFGESMFHRETNASKAAFVALARVCESHGIDLIDCQIYNPHLESLGATLISRKDFEKRLRDAIKLPMASILSNPRALLPPSHCALDVRLQGQVPRRVEGLL
jgi:leucyl/phenylalanyl-tRNA--protein transferase